MLRDSITFLYVDDIRTSQETHLRASTACCGDSFTFLYVDDVRISQEPHLWASKACYGDSFTFVYKDAVRISQETQVWASKACYGDSFTFHYMDMDIDMQRAAAPWNPIVGVRVDAHPISRADIVVISPLCPWSCQPHIHRFQ
jgi:hypothetical protein